ncbi:hypothetical protein PINS_up007646 [Pythium insidiosum]|nr:hypothetical protein PINS_up007646 [Pythium insidiosum]
MFGSSSSALLTALSSRSQAPLPAPEPSSSPSDAFELGDDYGDDAARELVAILSLLDAVGFTKARATGYSVFDRILGGLCWLLQRLVRREDARHGRVHWELLFQSHDKMRPRLGLAQEVVRRLDALPQGRPTAPIQPHQLLLQDFGDIGAVRRLVLALVAMLRDDGVAGSDVTPETAVPSHLARLQATREYVEVLARQRIGESVGSAAAVERATARAPLKREVLHLEQSFSPVRRYQYSASGGGGATELALPEDELIQRCLLEYGERVAVAAASPADPDASEQEDVVVDSSDDPRASLMQQLSATLSRGSSRQLKSRGSVASMTGKSDFDAQYQRAVEQALAEEHAMLVRQRARETELLAQIVAVPQPTDAAAVDHGGSSDGFSSTFSSASSASTVKELRELEATLEEVQGEHAALQSQREQLQAHAATLDAAIEQLHVDQQALTQQEQALDRRSPVLATLRGLVAKNEELKTRRRALKTEYQRELAALQARVAARRRQIETDAANADEETLRLQEIEQLHTQLATRHQELRSALSRETRAWQRQLTRLDDVPTQCELVQYETRCRELYDEVALTLEETRKYYGVYNTLKTTHGFLEKEIALLDSISANVEIAVARKDAQTAFLEQLGAIVAGVETSLRKQKALRTTRQQEVETLDSKYQVLLAHERQFVHAIREFQKECERHDRLSARMEERLAVTEDHHATGEADDEFTMEKKMKPKKSRTTKEEEAEKLLDDVVI